MSREGWEDIKLRCLAAHREIVTRDFWDPRCRCDFFHDLSIASRAKVVKIQTLKFESNAALLSLRDALGTATRIRLQKNFPTAGRLAKTLRLHNVCNSIFNSESVGDGYGDGGSQDPAWQAEMGGLERRPKTNAIINFDEEIRQAFVTVHSTYLSFEDVAGVDLLNSLDVNLISHVTDALVK